MTNGGRFNPHGAVARNVTPDGWLQREILATSSTLKDIPSLMSSYRTDQGGVCSPSCIFVHAQPSSSLPLSSSDAAWVFESDRSNGVYRRPSDVLFYHPLLSREHDNDRDSIIGGAI